MFYKYGLERRRELGNALLWLLIPGMFLFAVMTYVGSYWPELLQPSVMLAMLFLLALMIIYSIIAGIRRLITRKKKTNPKPKIYGDLLALSLTLAIVTIGILCDALALFGVIDIALSIQLPNKSITDFNFAKWLLLDGTSFFLIGILGTAFSVIPKKKKDENKDEEAIP
jgi:hypothetical protein